MSSYSTIALQAVPTLGPHNLAIGATGSDVTLVSAEDNVAGVLIVTASVWARSGENDGIVQSYLRTTNSIPVVAAASGGGDSASACGGPFIIPAGEEVLVGGSNSLCGYSVNWEVLS